MTCFPDKEMYFDIRRVFDEKHGSHSRGDEYLAENQWENSSHDKRVKLHKAVLEGKWDRDRLDDLILYFIP